MSNDRKLFAITRWVLKFGVIATSMLIVLIVVGALTVIYALHMGFIAEGLASAAREAGQSTLYIAGWHANFDSTIIAGITADEAARLVLAGLAGFETALILVLLVLRAILRIVVSASDGDPFVSKNAADLTRVAWLLLGINAAQMLTTLGVYGLVPPAIREKLTGDAVNIPVIGLFAALLIFVLARIFKHGAEMRAELEGTV